MIPVVTVKSHWIKGFLEGIRARGRDFHGSVRSANDARRWSRDGRHS